MPSTMNESYGIESTKSGFEGEETLPASKQDKDKDKVNKIVNDKDLPEEAEKVKHISFIGRMVELYLLVNIKVTYQSA
jgi:hypothetical protein